MGVVGDKGGAFEHLLHHRVAALHDGESVGVVHLGHAVAIGGGHGGQRHQYVHLGHGGGSGLNPVHLLAHQLLELAEELILQGGDLVLGGEDGVLQLL